MNETEAREPRGRLGLPLDPEAFEREANEALDAFVAEGKLERLPDGAFRVLPEFFDAVEREVRGAAAQWGEARDAALEAVRAPGKATPEGQARVEAAYARERAAWLALGEARGRWFDTPAPDAGERP